MKLCYFKGSLFEWCSFVNSSGLSQKQISSCNMQLVNNEVIVMATYWEIKEDD